MSITPTEPHGDFALIVRTPVHKLASKTGEVNKIPGGDVTARARSTWSRNIIWKLGADVGNFSITGDAVELVSYFGNWLSLDVVEMVGDVCTWNGMITELVYHHGAMPRRRSRFEMYNRVRGIIGDGIGTYTAFYSDTVSQARYGIRTKYLETGTDSSTAAVYEVRSFLNKHAWPNPKPTGSAASLPAGQARLDVTVCGYGATLNDMYGNDVALTPSSGVSAALTVTMNDSDYINPRGITSNTTRLQDDIELIEAGELTKKLLSVSDSSFRLYRGWIDAYRNFRYRVITNEPQYYLRGGQVYATPGSNAAINPRMLQPGIYRDLDYPDHGAHLDSWFADRQDIWVQGVFVGPDGRVRYQPEDAAVSDFGTLLWMEG